MSNPEEFRNSLIANGINADTVDPGSVRGALADEDWKKTKHKTYYRSSISDSCGVLLLPATSDRPIESSLSQLTEEASNFKKLAEAGFDVPALIGEVFETGYNLAGGVKAAALVVEHINGRGPYKEIQPNVIMKYINSLKEPARSAGKDAWAKLQLAALNCCPMDFQLLITDAGRIVTIDPEKIGEGKQLPNWNDHI